MSMHRRRERTHTVHGAATLGANYAILHLPGARRAMSQPGASEEEAMSRPIALLPLALAMSCAHAPAPGPAADVVELDARWAAAAAAGDGPGFRALVSADALFAGRSLLRGSEEVWGAWKAFFDEGGPRIRRPRLDDGALPPRATRRVRELRRQRGPVPDGMGPRAGRLAGGARLS